jgi:hypothetical protein
MKNNTKLFIKIGAAFMVLGSGIAFALASVASLAFPSSHLDTVVFGLIFGLSAVLSLASFREAHKEFKSIKPKQEKILYTLAAQGNGIVKSYDAAVVLNVSKEQAEDILMALVKQSDKQVQLEVNNDGEFIYIFEKVKPNLRVNKLTPKELAAGQELCDMMGIDPNEEPSEEIKEVSKLWK